MRKDMNKVLVERPRRHKASESTAARWRNDLDGPTHLGMRAGYGSPSLNENLSPLKRYLHAQVGRPWNKVYSEIAAGIDRRNTVQQHVYEHIDDFIAILVKVDGERLIDLRRLSSYGRKPTTVRQELYVDPRSGLIRVNKAYRTWRQLGAEHERERQAQLEARRRIVDERTQFHHLAGHWFRIEIASLPEEYWGEVVIDKRRKVRKRMAEPRFDVLLKRVTSRLHYADRIERTELYASDHVYAVSKRQMSHQELKAHGLL